MGGHSRAVGTDDHTRTLNVSPCNN